jgi:DNA segregation ATPase FtsK/SpoIIIE-like protein
LTLPYLAYAVTVLEAGYRDNALRRAPVAYIPLARELRLRNAGTSREILNLDQATELASRVRSLSEEERASARAYAEAALRAVGKLMPAAEEQLSLEEAPQAVPGQRSAWTLPTVDLLEPKASDTQISDSMLRSMEQRLQATLNGFRNLKAEVRPEYTHVGPRVLRFGILPTGIPVMQNGAPKRDTQGIVYERRTTMSQIAERESDIMAALEADSIRLQKPVPGTPFLGVEIPNPFPQTVSLREILESKEYEIARAQSRSKLLFALGRTVAGQPRFCDIAKAPHILVAGATNTGKSVLLNALICSVLMQATPEDVRMLMVDPKRVELTMYNGIRHLLRPVVTDVDKVVPLLKNALGEMDRRYRLFEQVGVRNLTGYRKQRAERLAHGDSSLPNLPAILIIIDELADLMMVAADEVETSICRLAQLARATGIHLVIATQRPSVDVITGLIKANIPTRIAFAVASQVDSRTIIDMVGAEKLLGAGDMLYLPADARTPERLQGAFVSDEDAEAMATFWQMAQPSIGVQLAEEWTDEAEEEDDLEEERDEREREAESSKEGNDNADEALVQRIINELLPGQEWISVSRFRRVFRIGETRAGRLMDILAARGLVGASPEGPRNERRVLLTNNGQLSPEQSKAEEASSLSS